MTNVAAMNAAATNAVAANAAMTNVAATNDVGAFNRNTVKGANTRHFFNKLHW